MGPLVAMLIACAPKAPPAPRFVPPPPPAPEPPPERPVEVPEAWYHLCHTFEGPGPLRSATEAWSHVLAGPVVHPITSDGERVYVVAAGSVFAFSVDGGRKAWEARVDAGGPASIGHKGILVPSRSKGVVLLDPTTGKTAQSWPQDRAVQGFVLPWMSDFVWVDNAGNVVSSAGWSVSAGITGGGGGSTDGERVYFSTLEGEVYAVGPDGVAWSATVPGIGVGAPANKDGLVYATFSASDGNPGGIAAFDAETGEQRWVHLTEFEPGASPAVGELLLLPGKDSRVYALDPTTGDTRWSFEGFGEFSATPSIAGRSAFAGNSDGRMHRLDLDDGGEAWVHDLGASVTGDPVIEGELLVVGLSNGRVVALEEGP